MDISVNISQWFTHVKEAFWSFTAKQRSAKQLKKLEVNNVNNELWLRTDSSGVQLFVWAEIFTVAAKLKASTPSEVGTKQQISHVCADAFSLAGTVKIMA